MAERFVIRVNALGEPLLVPDVGGNVVMATEYAAELAAANAAATRAQNNERDAIESLEQIRRLVDARVPRVAISDERKAALAAQLVDAFATTVTTAR